MRKHVPLVVLAVAFIVIICVSRYTYPSNPTPYLAMLFEWPHGVETLALIATLFVVAWQATLMTEHAEHFAKLAEATQKQTTGLEDTAKRQLRAYLTVAIGQGIFQQRRSKEEGGDLRFGSDPILVNTGETPAKKIRFKARAAILPWPLPKETHLPEGHDDGIGDSIVGGKQNVNMFAVVDGFCPDDEVQSIKDGVGPKGLFVWGRITYEDVFGDTHYTQFCQHIYWLMNGAVMGHYVPGRNDAD
jgi:hypothetical protein